MQKTPGFYLIALCRWCDGFSFHLQMTKWMVPLLGSLAVSLVSFCRVYSIKKIGRLICFWLDVAGLNADTVFFGWYVHYQQKKFWVNLLMLTYSSDPHPLSWLRPKCIKNGVWTLTSERSWTQNLQLPVQCLYAETKIFYIASSFFKSKTLSGNAY